MRQYQVNNLTAGAPTRGTSKQTALIHYVVFWLGHVAAVW